jgi:hypothetical protein
MFQASSEVVISVLKSNNKKLMHTFRAIFVGGKAVKKTLPNVFFFFYTVFN